MATSSRFIGHHLTTKDLRTVFLELYDARVKWNNIGLELGTSYSDLAAIKERNRDDPDECFKDLLSHWLKQANPTWEAIISALESRPVRYGQLAESIKKKFMSRYLPVITQSNTTTQSSNVHQPTNDEHFHCPCGQCDLISYLDNGCPKTSSKQYPYLELSELDEDDKEDLVQKLSEDTANIIQSFANLLSTTSESLNRRNVKVDKLVKVALDLGAFKSNHNQLPLLDEDRQNLQQANSIDSAFIFLGKHMSFFNYEILSHIINHLGNEEDKENLAKYCSQFEIFCERKVFEVPPCVFDPSGQKKKNRKLFVVLGTDDLLRTLNDVKAAQRKLASLLGLRVSTLQLKRVDLASVILVFSIPTSAGHFFPLDSSILTILSSIGFTLIIPDPPAYQECLQVRNKDRVDRKSLLSFDLESIDSGFVSRSSSQMTLNSISDHPASTVNTKYEQINTRRYRLPGLRYQTQRHREPPTSKYLSFKQPQSPTETQVSKLPPWVPPHSTYPYPIQSPAGTPGHRGMNYLPGQNGHSVVNSPVNAISPNLPNQRPEPPRTLHPALMSPTSSHGTPSPGASQQRGLTQVDQLEKLTASFRRKNKKIGVFYDSKQKQKADSIVRRLSDLLSGGVCIVQGFEILPHISDWLQRALLGRVDYFIFVGLPPSVTSGNTIQRSQAPQSITETAFFDVRRYVQRVAEVVVVFTEQLDSHYSHTPHYLDKFLRLENKNMDEIAENALSLFAAPCPMPFKADKAYFSGVPKLLTIPKQPGKSLGLSIMTREMSLDSEFPRIVLIKSFSNDCDKDVKAKLVKYTHIQSYNGVFLDGMDIKDVTAIFQSMRSPVAYLTVRYIHPIQSTTPTQRRTVTPICKPEAPRLDPLRGEELPIPLYILGDIYSLSKKLFDLLKEEAASPVSDSSSSVAAGATTPMSEVSTRISSVTTPMSEVSTQISSATTPMSEVSTQISSATTPMSEVSTQISSSAEQSCLGVDRNSQEEGSDIAASLGVVTRDINGRYRGMLRRNLSESDKALSRAVTSSVHFEGMENVLSSLSLERASSYPGNDHPPGVARQHSTAPPTGKKCYILQLPRRNLNRHFTHIFFRRNGIFLITIGLVEMMGDPLIQFENLCYWLRQVQTYVGPENIKRIIIVGVHDTLPGDTARLEKIDSLIRKLNLAIRENEFKQIMEISRERMTLPFNLSAPEESIRDLCKCINKCMDVMIDWAWCYEKEGFFASTFQPFTQLGSVLSKIATIKSIVANSQDLEDCYNYTDTEYKKTLANYSQACINAEGEYHLLRPTFLIELLRSMEMNSHNYMIHATNITFALKKVPIVSASFPKQQMKTLIASRKEFRQLVPDEEEAILEWAEKLELIYSLGRSGEHMLYFVPFLATEALGDQANYDWDYDEAEGFQARDITVLYAKIHIPASHQFFYGLIAELLKDVLMVYSATMEKNILSLVYTLYSVRDSRCCVNLGCKEAILPLHYVDDKLNSRVFRVYLQYHPLQNIIEFRAKIVKQQLAFLKTVENKLKGALGNSKSYGGSGENFNAAVTFTLPDNGHNSRLTDSALWTLGEPTRYVRPDGELDEEDFDEPDDLRGTELLETRIMTTDALREWASSVPEMKEIPTHLFLEWSKKLSDNIYTWMLLGSKLGLMKTDDIHFYKQNPDKGGNGELILHMWKDSDCSYKELVAALRDEDIGLDELALQIESHFAAV